MNGGWTKGRCASLRQSTWIEVCFSFAAQVCHESFAHRSYSLTVPQNKLLTDVTDGPLLRGLHLGPRPALHLQVGDGRGRQGLGVQLVECSLQPTCRLTNCWAASPAAVQQRPVECVLGWPAPAAAAVHGAPLPPKRSFPILLMYSDLFASFCPPALPPCRVTLQCTRCLWTSALRHPFPTQAGSGRGGGAAPLELMRPALPAMPLLLLLPLPRSRLASSCRLGRGSAGGTGQRPPALLPLPLGRWRAAAEPN